MKIPRTIKAPQSLAHSSALTRDLRPMIEFVRSRAKGVRSEKDAIALGRALKTAYSNARILAAVRARGKTAEREASRPWGQVDRLAKRVGYADAKRKKPASRVPYNGEQLLETWSREAASLIRSVRDEVAEGLRQDVLVALEHGTAPEALADRWISKGIPVDFGTLEGRARTIARHQLATLHAQVQSQRARALGVVDFLWRTQGDDRVRDDHQDLEGSRHAYSDPPSEGLPGQPIGCRCWAESVVPEELVEALGVSFLPASRSS